jgi:TetR/AcrR family transcriptional regulator
MIQETSSTQEKLIAAATSLFADKGFTATTVKDVADTAGVNISLVSYHFQGKENLYKTCIGNVGMRNLDMAQHVLQPVSNVDEFKIRLQLFIENMLLSYAQNPAITKIVHREFDTPSPFFEDLFQSIFLKTFQTLVDYISHAQQVAVLRTDITAEGIACTIIGSISHHGRSTLVAEKFLKKSLSDHEYRQEVVHILMAIIGRGVLV